MGYDELRLLIICAIPILSLFGLLLTKLIKNTPKLQEFARGFFIALLAYSGLELGIFIFRAILRDLGGYITLPLSLAQDSIPVLFAIWLVWRLAPSFRSHKELIKIPRSDSEIKEYIGKIFHSDKFLNALHETLPKGEQDEKHGLDYIPYMLSSIRKRRKKFRRSSNFFLSFTIILGFIFSGIVMYFGYILVNEAATGIPKRIVSLNSELIRIRQNLNVIAPGYFNNQEFKNTVGKNILSLEQAKPGENNTEIAEKINKAIDDCKNTGEFGELRKRLNSYSQNINKDTEEGKQFDRLLSTTIDSLNSFMDSYNAAIPNLVSSMKRVELLVPELEKWNEKPQNRVAEISKRIALGIVVCSFFLAILKYIASIYKSHHAQVLKADFDDFAVRRFYVSYKGSEGKEEVLKAVLTTFLSEHYHGTETTNEKGISLSKAESDLLNTILKNITKNIST